MNPPIFLMAALLGMSVTAMAATPVQPSNRVLARALDKHLQQYGNVCLGKFDWPIDVSAKDIAAGGTDAVQMPVLEKIGLVVSSAETVSLAGQGQAEQVVSVQRYALTEAGRHFYLRTESTSTASNGAKTLRQNDFCAGKLRLKTLVHWDPPVRVGAHQETTVSYTYTFEAAPWTRNPEIRTVFPMLDRLIKGAGSMELKQGLRLTENTWEAVTLWE